MSTSSANWNNSPTGAQTHYVDALPAHVSTLTFPSLMPKVSGLAWNGQVVCEYQPWFSVNQYSSWGGAVYPYNSHIDIDYDEDAYDATNNPFQSAVLNQDSVMIQRGCNINFIDFFGSLNSSMADQSHQFDLGATNNVYSDLAARYNQNTGTYPMKFAILEDESAFKTECDGSPDEVTCIEEDLETDMAYIYTNYIQPLPTHIGPIIASMSWGSSEPAGISHISIATCSSDQMTGTISGTRSRHM